MSQPLVTSTNEFIKNIGRHIQTNTGKEIQNRLQPNKIFIIKAFGFREYFEGNYQLL